MRKVPFGKTEAEQKPKNQEIAQSMHTQYEIRNAKLDGIFISFDAEWDAKKWWTENCEGAPDINRLHGAVVVKHSWEMEDKAETKRLEFLLSEGSIAKFSRECLREDYEASPWLTFARAAIDQARKAPLEETTVIWPKKDCACHHVNNQETTIL